MRAAVVGLGVLFLALLSSPGSAAPAPKIYGAAVCSSLDTHPAACYIAWRWDEKPRAAAWIQMFDGAIKAWRTIAEVPSTTSGTSLDAVETGKLYQVRSCDDPAVSSTCISTSVVWAPLRPPIDEIPPAIVSEQGVIMDISKNLPYATQAGQLNAIAMNATFSNVDMTQMPPMTRPSRRWDDKEFEDFDNIRNNVFDWYEAWRMPQPAEQGGASPTPIENLPTLSIAEVPPDNQNKFRARHLHGGGIEDSMITFGPSEPKHTVIVFADISCQHCQQMMRDLEEVTSLGIQVRFMAFPLEGPYSVDGRKMADVWCAVDRKAAFKRAMLNETVPAVSCSFDTVLHHYALAKKLGFTGSPTILTDDGVIIGGYLTPNQLRDRLQQLQAQAVDVDVGRSP